ncbi:MAG: hypothetical protein IT391_09935 [Nitrospira sp.]|nr:hypothetical protein [Nitrospira sp.]
MMDKLNKLPTHYRANANRNHQAYAAVLQQIVSLANSGAMLGHDHAYDACLKIEAIATEALRRPIQPPR